MCSIGFAVEGFQERLREKPMLIFGAFKRLLVPPCRGIGQDIRVIGRIAERLIIVLRSFFGAALLPMAI
jgi:hypothetical protein